MKTKEKMWRLFTIGKIKKSNVRSSETAVTVLNWSHFRLGHVWINSYIGKVSVSNGHVCWWPSWWVVSDCCLPTVSWRIIGPLPLHSSAYPAWSFHNVMRHWHTDRESQIHWPLKNCSTSNLHVWASSWEEGAPASSCALARIVRTTTTTEKGHHHHKLYQEKLQYWTVSQVVPGGVLLWSWYQCCYFRLETCTFMHKFTLYSATVKHQNCVRSSFKVKNAEKCYL